MATISRDGVSIYYERHGSRTGAPTILLSHGYSATSGMWAGQVKSLGDRYEIITWDMRGHGKSDSPDDPSLYSEHHTVEDMTAILDECGVSSAIIGGLSLGGYMTLAFHLAYPERCVALMLFDTGPGYRNPQARAGWNANAEARAAALEKDGLSALGAGNEVRIAHHRSAQGLALAARGMLAQVDDRVIQSLPRIDIPVLVLVGEDDTPFRAPSDYMAGKIPGARKVVLSNAGHASNIDQPGAFDAAVTEFISGIGA
jgi:pimeloyl-ACP methyl ester carboxylesterase